MPVINKLIGAMLAVVVGVVMLPVIIDSVTNLRYTDGNLSTPATLPTGVDSLVQLLPLLFVIIIIGGVIGYIAYRR